ncbi:uncharacterized protein TNCT_450511 [Trichonephila clavata]|uniref:Uncharacterized protein n=1 Tax=Trichonephila clavata TaxID=2740835 RepID=A0A8X6KJD3_TRICU|nr:uncharacterized protein TNCT_450511 [Trichonephila clavata]
MFNIIRVSTEPAIILHLQTVCTFGIINKDNIGTKLSKTGEIVLKVIGADFNIAFFVFPPTVAVTLFLVLLQELHLLKGNLKKLQKLICDDKSNRFRSFWIDLSKTVSFVKTVNTSLSPLIFALTAFWTAGIFYNVSKLLYRQAFSDIFSFISSGYNAINYTVHFLVFVMMSAEIPNTVSEMKRVVLQGSVSQDYLFFEERKSASINLLVIKLEHFKEEVTVTGLGLFKLEKSVILVCLGAAVSYELLIVQLMERNEK